MQCQSGGDAELIQEVALPVQNAPKKLGSLAVPVGLRVVLGRVPGQMQVRWEGVTQARGYLLESCVSSVTRSLLASLSQDGGVLERWSGIGYRRGLGRAGIEGGTSGE